MSNSVPSLDDFLSHTGGGATSFGGYLKNWKEDGSIDLWLHPKGLPAWVWAHRWFFVGKDRDTGKSKIRFARINSLEDEAVTKKRFARKRDGTLEVAPQLCPFARTLEWVWQAIENGEIGVADPIFHIDTDADEMEIHAGGFCGYFGRRDLSAEHKTAIKRAGIRLADAWKESCQPRLQYVFRVVVHDRPEDGCLVALEGQALGDKLKKVIEDRQDDVGKEKGNPFKHPYAFRWKFDDRKEFSAKYDVKAITSLELTEEIRAVFEQEPPSIDDILRVPNIAELRMSFEDAWVHKVVPPWDDLFGPAERRFGEADRSGDAEEDEDATEFNYGANKREGKEERGGRTRTEPTRDAARTTATRRREEPKAEEEDDFPEGYGGKGKPRSEPPPKRAAKAEPEREQVLCDACDKPMFADENECMACGAKYDDDGNLIKPREAEPPKRSRSRSGGTR